MSLLLTCFGMFMGPGGAEGTTDLAREGGVEAGRRSLETADLITAVDLGNSSNISETYMLDVYRFGRTSADLAKWLDTSNGPNDLGCIFRGMATESETQLIELETSQAKTEHRESLRRLAVMFADAEMIAIAAQKRAPAYAVGVSTPPSTCTAQSDYALDALR